MIKFKNKTKQEKLFHNRYCSNVCKKCLSMLIKVDCIVALCGESSSTSSSNPIKFSDNKQKKLNLFQDMTRLNNNVLGYGRCMLNACENL